MSIIVVFHKDCQASVNIISKLNDLSGYSVEYIDIYNDKFEADIDIDVVPIIIINDTEVYKGKEAFDKIEELKMGKSSSKKMGKRGLYQPVKIAPEDNGGKKKQVRI